MRKLALLLSLLAFGALGLVACGGGDDEEAAAASATPMTTMNSPPIRPTTSPAPTPAAGGSRWFKATFRVARRDA